jgi:aminoglycoside 3-N-acetyltransferase
MKEILEKDDLIAGLVVLGLAPSCRVMVHASLSSLGLVNGGASTVVTALREAAGPDGAVIIPSFRDAIRSDNYALRECRDSCPRDLCPSRERGFTGVIGETLREQDDSLRSCHPTHSWVGIGRDAKFLLEGHCKSRTPCGKDSPFFKLMERDGKILLLGVGINSITNIHAVEDARNVPYLSAIDLRNRHATYTTSGRRIQYVYPELLLAAFREAGILRMGKIGLAVCYVLSARSLGAFLWVVTEDDPWRLVLRPRGNEYEPFDDACMKTSRMVSAWKSNPDLEAWKRLLEESRRPAEPVQFKPAARPAADCPAYRGVIRGYHRCAANDVPPWEKFEDYPQFEPGVATCDDCNWPVKK